MYTKLLSVCVQNATATAVYMYTVLYGCSYLCVILILLSFLSIVAGAAG